MNFTPLLAYFSYLGSGLVAMALFMLLYERITPYRELALIREGNLAAGLSFGGALLGFVLTLASSAMHALGWKEFIGWALVAGLVQLVAFGAVCLVVRRVKEHIENGNVAVGASLFCISLGMGILNAACLA